MKIDGSNVLDIDLDKVNLLYLAQAIRGVARAIDDASITSTENEGLMAELCCAATILADINSAIMSRVTDPSCFTVAVTEKEARNEH